MNAIDFETKPSQYKHLKLTIDGPVATLTIDTQENGGLRPGYKLKLNSYDLGVDIELADAVERLRFEHPEVRVVAGGLGVQIELSRALNRATVVAAVGPTCASALERFGIQVNVVPRHPKMGHMVLSLMERLKADDGFGSSTVEPAHTQSLTRAPS